MLLYKDLTIYDMKKAFDEGINQFFTTSFGALHPAVKKLYEEFLDEPNSHKAHELLHTHYIKKSIYKEAVA